MLFSIRKSLSIVLLILTALYAISVTINTMSAISEYRRALKIHYNNIIADALFDAVQHYGFERGRVNVVLRDAGPVSQMESNRIFIRQQRDAGDDALKNAMDRIKMAGLFTPEVDRITSQWTAVQYLRADGDRECSIPLAERTKELVPRWFETMTSFINSIETLLEALSSDEDNFDAMARELFYLKMRTLALRNTSGPECSMVLASYGTNGTLPAEDLKKIFSLRGASTLLVEDVASAVQRIRDPRLKEAMLNFRQLYEQEFLPIQRASLDAIYSGAPLPLERAQYSKIMVDALKSIAPVMEASVAMPFECESFPSPDIPLLGLFIDIDMGQLNDLISQMNLQGEVGNVDDSQFPLGIGPSAMDEDMKDAAVKLLKALRNERDARILAPGLVRELYYRALCGAQAPMLYSLVRGSNSFSTVARVINLMEGRYSQKINVQQLAESAHMSVSAFHKAFKEITAESPLQYLKKIRLTRARDLIVQQNMKAYLAADAVGYESPSQFSREFKRYFGLSPTDVVREIRSV